MGFRRRDGDCSCVCGRIDVQSVILDVWSRWKARCWPILLCVSYYFISVTKLWDMIIHLCMCKGRTHCVNVLQSKSHCKTAQMFSFHVHMTVKRQSKSNLSDEICEQNLSEWCHTCHRQSSQRARRIDLNNNRHVEFIHVSNCITRRTDLVHIVEIVEIACGTSCKLRTRSWIRNSKEVELYLLKTSEMIYMPSIAGRKRENVIGQVISHSDSVDSSWSEIET